VALSDVIRQAADRLQASADVLQRGMQRFAGAAGRLGGAAGGLSGAATAAAEARAREAQGRVQALATPQGAALYLHQQQLQGAAGLAEMQLLAQQARLQAAYLATPAGRGEARAQASARTDAMVAQRGLALAQDLAERGPLAVAVSAMGRAFGVVTAAAGGAAAALYGVGRFVQAANPSAMMTFTNSLLLLEARIGRGLVPIVDFASQQLQEWADTLRRSGAAEGARTALGGFFGGVQWAQARQGGPVASFANPGIALAGLVNAFGASTGLFNFGAQQGPGRRSVVGGQGGVMSAEQAEDMVSNAILGRDELEADRHREVMEATHQWLALAGQIEQNTQGLRPLLPSFR
jgi:hypothetical protein